MALVSTEWLENNLNKVKIVECTWHMPNIKRDSHEEFLSEHIEGALYFDLDKNSNLSSDLPHMLPDKNVWEAIVSNLGIKNDDLIVIYDNSEVLSACR